MSDGATDTDPIEQVQQLFPIDGPYSPDATRDAAASAAECIRYLNHATSDPRSGAIVHPAHVSRMLSSLNALAADLQQLLNQLVGQLGQFAEHPGLYDDSRSRDERATLVAAQRAMKRAGMGLRPVTTLLSEAFEHANRLGIDTPEEGDS